MTLTGELVEPGDQQSQYKDVSIGIPILKIRRSNDSVIFNMGTLIPGKVVILLKRGPMLQSKYTYW